MLCSLEVVSFNIICLNALEGIKQLYFLMWFMKYRLEIPFKGDNVKALIKTSNNENLVLYISRKCQQIAPFAVLFGFQWQNNSLKMVWASPNDLKCPQYPLVLKSNVTLDFIEMYTIKGQLVLYLRQGAR